MTLAPRRASRPCCRAAEAEVRAQGGDAAQVQALRERLAGPEAAARLADLDRRRADWDARVQAFRAARTTSRAGHDAVTRCARRGHRGAARQVVHRAGAPARRDPRSPRSSRPWLAARALTAASGMPSALVIGGGVGGLTAAHELVDRGYAVTLYESRPTIGGKARSQPVAGTGTGGRQDLPGEHGFRFYPRFYRHVIDLMQRTPRPGGGTVADSLRPTTESAIALVDDDTWYRFYRRRLDRPFAIAEALELFFQELDFDAGDIALFTAKILAVPHLERGAPARRVRADVVVGLPRGRRLLAGLPAPAPRRPAHDGRDGSAARLGAHRRHDLDAADPRLRATGVTNDRTMGGPTTEMWFDPWIDHLPALGVTLLTGGDRRALEVAAGRITGVKLSAIRRRRPPTTTCSRCRSTSRSI